ncbi:MAG: corrinoid protein [Clostridia bacterium]|nr:corrinoid protein [Clostridia bacterium]
MVEAGKAKDVTVLVTEALEKGIEPARVMNEGLVAGMTRLGEKFRNGEAFVPEVLMASRAMNVALSVLRPALQRDCVQPLGRAVICTVKGDMHDIGKNMVRMMLEGKGIECIDLGVDVSPASVAEAVRTHEPDLVCLSSLLTTTMPGLGDVICALRESGLRDRVTVMVGGAPVTQAFADEIGADIYTKDASSAAEAAALVCAANRRDK